MLYDKGEGLPPAQLGSSIRIEGATVPRWNPKIVVADAVRTSPALEILGYRGPSKYAAPDIRFSDPQPLMVRGGSFTVLAERQGIVPGSTYLVGDYDWKALFAGVERTEILAERLVLVAANCVATSYYHWLFQCLAPVLIAQSHGLGQNFSIIVPPLPLTLRESLAMAGVDQDRLVELPRDAAAITDHGIYTNLTSGDFAFVPHPAIIDAFRSFAADVPSSVHAGRRIFISRADAAKRPMVNETELAEALRSLDFEIILCGALPFAEQVALFRDAGLIVAQHGAALANLLFARDGADGPMVIELHQEDYINQVYLKICQAKALRYWGVVNPVVEAGAGNEHQSKSEADIGALLKLLAGIG